MPTRKIATHKKLTDWLLRSLLVVGQRSRVSNTGFVLPTVVMVTLVVVLLTTALVIRSFDRSKNASNTRVNEVALSASSPAIDRARAKLNALFDDPTLPRATPSDTALYSAIKTNTRYTFGDETRLKVASDFNSTPGIQPSSVLEQDETLTTAWRFPVDTDNNGKFDSYTLYGIFFRSPPRNSSGQFSRVRTPLDAKAPPMDDSALGGQCANALGTSASLVGDSGWYKSGSKLKKSFFVYTATVPITNAAGLSNTFEAYRGNQGFSALEYQQDRGRIPLSNNAVVYEDDLQLTPGPAFNLNGRVFTNSNFLVAEGSNPIRLYQVSSKSSCYYEEETGKIIVGGNIASGAIDAATDSSNAVDVHLFRGKGINPTYTDGFINSTNKSTTNNPRDIAYNNQAYIDRINFLVASAIARGPSSVDPPDVRNNIQQRLSSDPSLNPDTVRRQELEVYFRKRTRRVPFLEVPFGANALVVGGTTYNANTPNTAIFPSTNPLTPPNQWMFPTDPTDGKTGTGYTGLTLNIAGNLMRLPMTFIDKQKRLAKEMLVGDRVGVGNNLPELVYNTVTQQFGDLGTTQPITGVSWNNPNNGTQVDGDATVRNPRTRQSFVTQLADLGITDRDGFWEKAAAQAPATLLDNLGGLRVVTGAGIFSTQRRISGVETSFLPDPPQATYDDPNTAATEAFSVVWPDTMPMWEDTNRNGTPDNLATDRRGDLVMRATAVYHYQNNAYNPAAPATYQTPIACVSSYYDPSTSVTAQNISTLPFNAAAGGRSNNGISYGIPSQTASNIGGGSGPGTDGRFTPVDEPTGSGSLRAKLNYQANLVYPSGRFVNEQLRQALINRDANKNLTLAEQSAIDSTICAIEIQAGTLSASDAVIPHGAIREVSFLNASQIKEIDRSASNLTILNAQDNGTNIVYNMPQTGNLKVGDVINIRGFSNGRFNATNAAITGITTNTNIRIASTGSAIATETAPARIVEALTGTYDLDIEERQPLEVRATVLNLNLLRQRTIGGASPAQEYLLPNSGIIYATRDDALLDLSASLPPEPTGITAAQREQRIAAQKLSSPVDFKLDPSRRPNAILLEEGSNLSRQTDYRPEEKGLILATNLPAYVLGNFNLHTGGSGQEFTPALTGAWGENDFYNRNTFNTSFACRPGQFGTGTCSPGDTWRPASVLADSITLLSESFGFGFRDQGNYDLNNNQEYNFDAKLKRLRAGFFSNYYAASANWWNAADGYPLADYDTTKAGNQGSSYVNNFVTPIQRRVSAPEYLMEMCVKLPVSECGFNDWWVRPPGTNSVTDPGLRARNAIGNTLTVGTSTTDTVHTSGTTTRIALPGYRQYARRIAFLRNRYGGLEFTQIGTKAAAIPIGINATGAIAGFPYTGAPPRLQNNTLWFGSVKNVNTVGNAGYGDPGFEANRTYANDQPLYYLPPDKSGTKLILPDTQCFTNNDIVPCAPDFIPGGGGIAAGTINLNLPKTDLPASVEIPDDNRANNQASDYTLCLSAASGTFSQNYTLTNLGTVRCPQINGADNDPLDVISDANAKLAVFTPHIPATSVLKDGSGRITTQTLNAVGPVTVIDFGGGANIASGATITLNGGTQPNAVFVIQTSGNTTFLGSPNGGLVIDLVNVNPNDVFWIQKTGKLDFQDATAARPHSVVGNFIGQNAVPSFGQYTYIDGGRFLGYQTFSQPPANARFTASVGDGQPLLAPVLQLQVTTAGPADTTFENRVASSNPVASTRWMPQAVETTFNLVSAAGDTPARVGSTSVPTGGEPSGGLHNFVRFLELWTTGATNGEISTNISGSFIQFKRSAYATAPHQPLFNVDTNNAPSLFGYLQGYRIGNDPGAGGTNNLGKVPYYAPPTRNWGFDVALLTQLPDLFAQRFTLPPAGAPDEFFREVGRDDRWVTNLLCAAAADGDGKGGTGATYTNFAVPDRNQRPANCQGNTANYPSN